MDLPMDGPMASLPADLACEALPLVNNVFFNVELRASPWKETHNHAFCTTTFQ